MFQNENEKRLVFTTLINFVTVQKGNLKEMLSMDSTVHKNMTLLVTGSTKYYFTEIKFANKIDRSDPLMNALTYDQYH